MDPATANSVSNIFMTQFTSSAVVVYIMQKLKNAKWFPILEHGQATVSRLFSIGAAGAVAMGINYTWNPQTRGLLITLPTLYGALVGAWHWLNQFALQETVYQATVNKISITTQPKSGEEVIPAKVTAEGKMVVPLPVDSKP
jgi:hypothetical protein